MAVPTAVVLDKFPSVILHKHDGTGRFASKTVIHPGESIRRFSSPARFKLIPINASGGAIDPEDRLESRASFRRELKTWKDVAIFCEKKGAFLSCGRKSNIPGMRDAAPVEHRSEVGSSELFELRHHPETESVSFRSHNGLYLNDNRAIGGFVFRSEPRHDGETVSSHRAWEITPDLEFLSTDQRIKFVGVIDSTGTVIMELEPMPGGEPDEGIESYDGRSFRDNPYLQHAACSVLGDARANGLKRGESTHFREKCGDCHYYTRDKCGTLFIVVVSRGFSRALAGECMNDLAAVYNKFSNESTKRNGSMRKLFEAAQKRDQRIEAELRFLVWNYNEHNESLRHHPLRRSICDRMEATIDRLLNDSGNRFERSRRVRELTATAAEFRKNMRQLRAKRLSKRDVWGCVGGGMVGMAVGGPPGAAVLGSQSAKLVGSGAGKGVAVWSSGSPMWKNYSPSSNFEAIELHC